MVSLIQPGTFQLETNGNLGAVEIMTFLSLILLGISLSLGYTFFRRSEGDRFSLKVLVRRLMNGSAKAFSHLSYRSPFSSSHTVYYETVTRWNRGEANSYPLSINVLSENLITFLVQWFFSHRIYRLSGSLLLSLICSSFAFLRFVGGIALSVESILDVPRNPNGVFVFSFRWLVITALAIGALADVLIAISMVYNLRKFASPLNLKSTTAALNRLVRWTLRRYLQLQSYRQTVSNWFYSRNWCCYKVCTLKVYLQHDFCHRHNLLIWFALYIVLAKRPIRLRFSCTVEFEHLL
ncbi:hypothetical protein CVT26_006489 [Gymnopilus dilepis]|uniref:Uncharacterized protein n=1 Tax=Gymnopilus dilepis TaxID=231916 RepID=A0A409W6E3_9AGAR|nr:hypothetical protein CVT26_006489 [Gymnopilus dilepis]